MLNRPRRTPVRIPPFVLFALAISFLWPGLAGPALAAPADAAPAVSAPPTVNGVEGTPIQFDVYASDPDGDPITFLGLCGGSPGVCLSCFTPDPGNQHGVYSWTPGFSDAGTYSVCFTAQSTTLSASATTVITVANMDRNPVVAAPAKEEVTCGSGLTVVFTVTASDPDGDAITSLTAAPLPSGATFSVGPGNTNGTFNWTPGISQCGTYSVTFTAANALTGTASTLISVQYPELPPVVTAPATQTVNENMNLNFTVSASDPNGDPITSFTASPLPPGATFTKNAPSTSGTFSWTPSFTQAGTYSVTFTASDGFLSGSAATAITVVDVDRAPVVSAPPTFTIPEMTLRTFTVTAADPDGDAITSLTAAPLPTGATFTANASNTAGTFSWQPSFAQAGAYTVTFTACNALCGSASTTILVCDGCDRAPVVTAPPSVSAIATFLLAFNVYAADPDGEAIVSFTADLSGLPPGNDATFAVDATNTQGTFAWTPASSVSGTFVVTFTASNSLSGSAATMISVSISPGAPVVTAPATATVNEGALLQFDVTASDPEGGVLSLSALGLPPGATFTDHGDNTGTLAWLPTYSQAGSYTVTFRALDSQGLTGQASTAITVLDVNRAPTAVAGGPYQGFVGLPVPFDGTASSDPDGDPLTFDWSFGDGATGSGATTSHAYGAIGTYTVDLTVTDPAGLTGTDGTTADIRTVCDATLFQTGGNRTLRLNSGKPIWCTEVEPVPGCFTVDQVIISSIVLKYPAGTGAGVPAVSGKTSLGGDADHDGIEDISACFSKDDLRPLFAALPGGENFVEVSVEGDLIGGGRFAATGTIRVFATGGALAAQITPSPLRGSGEISFVTRQPGRARVRLFDLQGRVVRTLLDEGSAAAGSYALRFDGRGKDGAPLAAGVYFFRIEADGKEETGRMVIAR